MALPVGAGILLLFGVCGIASAIESQVRSVQARERTGAKSADSLFDPGKVHEVHLTISAADWALMEPQGGRGFPGPMGGRRDGGGGPDLLAQVLAGETIRRFDADTSGVLEASERATVASSWFSEWREEARNSLGQQQIAAGLQRLLPLAVEGGMRFPPGMERTVGGQSSEMVNVPTGVRPDGKASRRNGMSAMSGAEFVYVPASLTFDEAVFAKVAVRYKGNNTFMTARNTLKRSLKIDINRFQPGQTLLGVHTINLHNNITDPGWMNEPLSYRLFRDAGVPAPRTSWARVFVTVPGLHESQYLGLYSLVENPDNRFAVDRYGTKKGAIFKPVGRRLFEYLGEAWSAYAQVYDAKTALSPEEQERVIDFGRLVTQADDAVFAARLGDYLDLDEFARFMAVTVWLSNMDSLLTMGQNYVVYLHPKTRQFQFLPWDLDHSFGQFPMAGSRDQLVKLSLLHPWSGENRFLERVFQVRAFRSAYLGYLREFSGTFFRPERLRRQVDELSVVIRTSVQEEGEERLRRFERVVAGEAVQGPGPGGGPGFGADFGGKSKAGGGQMPPIKGFVVARHAAVLDQLDGKAEGEIPTRGGPGGPGGPGGIRARRGPDEASSFAPPPRSIPPGEAGGAVAGSGGRPFGGAGFMGPGGFGGRGAPFAMLAQAILKEADADHDGRVTEGELRDALERLWGGEDKAGSALNAEQIAKGFSQLLQPSRPNP